jgi:heme-degrading monooxygenase HmoA
MKLLERPLPGAVEVVVITFWQSAEAVRGFAGDDPEQAVVADEAAALLTDFDRRVRHYEVLADDAPAA